MKPIEFWAGQEGDQYHSREENKGEGLNGLAARTAMWVDVLRHAGDIHSVCELGANIGLNLIALRRVLPHAKLTGVEVNADACEQLSSAADKVVNESIQGWIPEEKYDLTFTRGVLIHIPPEDLAIAYSKLYYNSRKYIMVAEYFSQNPTEIEYRGQKGLLWKRDFAGEMLKKFPDLKVVDYGFIWKLDPHWAQDDLTWTLMVKS